MEPPPVPPSPLEEPATPAAVAPPVIAAPAAAPPPSPVSSERVPVTPPSPIAAPQRVPVPPPTATPQPEFSKKTTHVAYAPPPGRMPVEPEVRRTRRSGGGWWIVPLAIIGLILLAFIVLSLLPDDDKRVTTTTEETTTIAEGSATQSVGTIGEMPPVSSLPPPTVIEEQPGVLTGTMPPNVAGTQTAMPPPGQQLPPAGQRLPPPGQQIPPATQTTVPTQTAPAAPAPAPTREQQVTAAAAADRLRGYITSRNYYDGIADSCVQVRPGEFSNGGYTMQVWHACPGSAGSRLLGRWRVDSTSGEVFRQREDGRFLSP